MILKVLFLLLKISILHGLSILLVEGDDLGNHLGLLRGIKGRSPSEHLLLIRLGADSCSRSEGCFSGLDSICVGYPVATGNPCLLLRNLG